MRNRNACDAACIGRMRSGLLSLLEDWHMTSRGGRFEVTCVDQEEAVTLKRLSQVMASL